MNLNDKILEENYIVTSQSDGLKPANIYIKKNTKT